MWATHVYLNTITQLTASTYMNTHAHICTHIMMDLELTMYLQMDTQIYSRMHMNTYPDAWDITNYGT